MKRVMVCLLALTAILLTMGFAGASAECNNPEQIILRLSAESNAHASLWDSEDYVVKVCYDRYFDIYDDEVDEEAHACGFGGGNRLFYLSGTNNAHASIDGNDNYPIEVCHDGVSGCELVDNTGQNTCQNIDKKPIVFLSAETNAHLSRRYDSNYPFVVCCKGIGTPSTPTDPTICAHYSDSLVYPSYYGRENCTEDPLNLSVDDPLCPLGEKTCRCIWTNNRCSLIYNSTSPSGCQYTCSKNVADYDSASCNEGFKNVTVEAVINPIGCSIGPDELIEGCEGTTTLIPCSFGLAELPFFGIWQFMAAITAIAFVYVMFYRKKAD
ncbi:MAG: hypothetical protein MUF61_00170 [archaeon]|nr:hypothetical protein [archaeon]